MWLLHVRVQGSQNAREDKYAWLRSSLVSGREMREGKSQTQLLTINVILGFSDKL